MHDIMGIVDHMIKNGTTSSGNYGMDELLDALSSWAEPIQFEISGDSVKITPNTSSSIEYVNKLLFDANYSCITIDGKSVTLSITDPIYLHLLLKYS